MSLHISDAVIWQETGDGISLYHSESGDFRTLNATAAQIWALVESDGDRETVIRNLSLLFAGHNPVMTARIRAEVDAFISSMVEADLIEETEAGTRPTRSEPAARS
ncbi:PqqD family protein [Streptomyces sp. NBC_01264]|uniref:PqqD family protein n=1 Tax=Streptomyces sp. NBC_01264 TaxID=2903804 RepID=UPI002256F6E5|nr:PqqD family protein [Streptomyces sp. NBC_01264]MCX4782623.1 PqqD family protein [Streptomyces sp. NBC_01264]